MKHKTILYLGTRKGLDKYMHDNDINPSEHGKSVKWGRNGPNHLRATDAPIVVIQDEDWYERTIWDDLAVSVANKINGLERHTRRKQTMV